MVIHDMNKVWEDIRYLRTYIERMRGQRDMIKYDLEGYLVDLAKIDEDITVFDKCRVFLQTVSEYARKQAAARIEEIVTNALRYVFGDNYSFKIELSTTAAGRSDAEFLVVTKHKDRTIVSRPHLGKGGGIVDILAVALKFSILEIMNYDGPIWMDEPFKQVSKNYTQLMGRLVQFMQQSSERQITIITHNDELAEMCANNLLVRQTNGISKIVKT